MPSKYVPGSGGGRFDSRRERRILGTLRNTGILAKRAEEVLQCRCLEELRTRRDVRTWGLQLLQLFELPAFELSREINIERHHLQFEQQKTEAPLDSPHVGHEVSSDVCVLFICLRRI